MTICHTNTLPSLPMPSIFCYHLQHLKSPLHLWHPCHPRHLKSPFLSGKACISGISSAVPCIKKPTTPVAKPTSAASPLPPQASQKPTSSVAPTPPQVIQKHTTSGKSHTSSISIASPGIPMLAPSAAPKSPLYQWQL
jgi:hypothetical protein